MVWKELKALFWSRKGNKYILSDDDRTSAKEKKSLKREQDELEHEIKMAKLHIDLEKVREKSGNEDLSEKIRDIVEEYMPDEETGSNQNDLLAFMGMMGMKPNMAGQPPAAIEVPVQQSPSPAPPTPAAEAQVPQQSIDAVIKQIPDFFLDEIANSKKIDWLTFSGALWETLNKRKAQ